MNWRRVNAVGGARGRTIIMEPSYGQVRKKAGDGYYDNFNGFGSQRREGSLLLALVFVWMAARRKRRIK